jgi:molecular chaperone HtpG
MTTKAERLEFQAETKELLDLMIHSLYSHKEIFLRELCSNASDALDKRRFLGLTDPGLAPAGELSIELEPDPAARTLIVRDNGIGMSREELIENLGTIARSGTKRFLLDARGKADAPELIGQFGVGFYSAFMVADEVVVESRRAGGEAGWRWRSRGDGHFELEPLADLPAGTRIVLHLKAHDEDEAGAQDFAAEWVLRDIVRRYSDFVSYPIKLLSQRRGPKLDDQGQPIEGSEETRREWVVINSQKPIWMRPKAEVSAEQYAELYRRISRGFGEPLETIHFRAEGSNEYTAVLFLPKEKPLELFESEPKKSRVQLYVKRVFITADCEELMPPWLRFVPGLVDSNDLPLNVSRETLQHNRQLAQIKKRLTRKVLDSLGGLAKERRADFEAFWGQFGAVLKEGLYFEQGDTQDELAGLCLFRSSRGEGWTGLQEYVERMPAGQPAIYTLAAPDLETARRSPHLERPRAKGYEVLFLLDPVDEFAFQRLEEWHGTKIQALGKGADQLEDEGDKQRRSELEGQHKALLEAMQQRLSGAVSGVSFSSRLSDAAAVLVGEEHSFSPHVEKLMRESGRGPAGPASRRRLELNPGHGLVERLEGLRESAPERFQDYCDLLYGQALLSEGATPPEPARFAALVAKLLLAERSGG